MKKILSIILIILLSLTFTQTINAEETKKDTILGVHVITDENLTAYINGSAGGDVDYYIDGIEVSAEFMALWAKINKLDNEIDDVDGKANQAWGYANHAYSYSDDNNQKINENNNTLKNHAYTLSTHYNAINDTYNKIYILKDEVVSFENHYLKFEDKTNNTLNNQSVTIGQQGSMINDLHDTNLGLQETVRAQSDQLEEMNSLLGLIKNTMIVLLIAAGLVVLLYLLNRRYPFGKIAGKAKKSIKNFKRERQPDYVKSSKKAQTKKTLMYKIKHTHIKRNPEKSPIKLFFSFLQIQK